MNDPGYGSLKSWHFASQPGIANERGSRQTAKAQLPGQKFSSAYKKW